MPKIYSFDIKIAVVNFYKTDLFTIENALNIFNISKSSLYNWIKLDNKSELVSKSNIRDSYKSKIGIEIEKYIITYVKKRCTFTVKNLRKCIVKIFNVIVSKSAIYLVLKNNDMTNKKISQKIVPKNRNIKKQIDVLINKINTYDSNNVVSIDESSFDTHMCPNYGWSKKGQPIKKIIKIPSKKRKTLTLAITKNQIIGYNLIDGSSKAGNFKIFLSEQVLPHVKNSILLMDNARIHHSKIVKDCVSETTNEIVYNVPYNPNTNPIEFVFSIIKNSVRKSEPVLENQLTNAILKSFKLITPLKLKNIFKHSLNI